ncbi:transporter substrate-binding domain-containing protein [Fundicoccus sp. Sow4_F4]|uniref:transporter substrate-binding domain-containing protein n=1 Tax=Fundicoccus sp. Sow4_F4 TaxID=3438783 RepID=UPI003F936C77
MKKFNMLLLALLAAISLSLPKLSVAAKSLDEIKEAGEIVLGTNAEYPPFEWVEMKDGEQVYLGIDFDLAHLIAEKIGVELVVSDQAFNALIPSLQAGKIDMAIASMSYTEERAEQVEFSEIYFETKNLFAVPTGKEADYQSIDDFSNVKIGVLKASVQEQMIKELFPDGDIVSMNKNGDLIESLKSGRVDVVLMDNVVIYQYETLNSDSIVVLDEFSLEDGSFGNAVAMEKGNSELKAIVDQVILEAIESGELDEIVAKNIDLSSQSQD